jgi:hypothetical protein
MKKLIKEVKESMPVITPPNSDAVNTSLDELTQFASNTINSDITELKKVKKPRVKKYKDEDGMSLSIQEDGHSFFIAWVDREGEVGAILGEKCSSPDWSMKTADNAAKIFASKDIIRKFNGYAFDDKQSATKALNAANMALNLGSDKPIPEWVIQAQLAGWTPPVGWKL